MSITVTQNIKVIPQYAGLGIAVSGDTQSLSVTYSLSKITSFDGNMITAEFTQSINNIALSEPYIFMFKYSGSGNPLDQAEPALQSYLS